MKFGNYECCSVEFGKFAIDGGTMFGVVPKALWQKKISADRDNLVKMAARSLLIQGNGKNIIVDTGLGEKMTEKMKKINRVDENSINIDRALSRCGLTRNDITDVLISHLHFDHCGGSTYIKNNEAVPTFPNAQYYIQKDQWNAAVNPSSRDKASFTMDDFLPLQKHNQLTLLDGPGEFCEGIEVFVTSGHTPGHQHVLVKGEKSSLFFCADLIPTTAHLPLQWVMAFDTSPVCSIEEKEYYLKKALNENWILFFGHDTNIPAAGLKTKDNKIIMDKVFDI